MKLSLGFSPCPNDTFIFDALVNRKIELPNMQFEVFMEDVETLNQWALQGKLDISKISFGVYPLLINDYAILNSGAALGNGVGPLLISKNEFKADEKSINTLKIAIPGEHTTANLLFTLAYPNALNKIYKVFSSIEDAVLNDEVDAGVIIHENRFTYEAKGLKKIIDLGNYWESKTNCPVPLGGIVMRRSIDKKIQKKVDELIKQSLEYAFAHYPSLPNFVKENAQEMDETIMRKHIDLYVNNYSLSLGDIGKHAIQNLLNARLNDDARVDVDYFV